MNNGAKSTMESQSRYPCFSRRTTAQNHHRAVQELYKAGVWIGYYAPEKYSESYQGLPTFNQLKTNAENSTLPFPVSIHGTAGENRHGVCRGCHTEEAQPITLQELSFIPKKKLVIMPLYSAAGEKLFCILIPQPNDHESMKGLQTFRFYETSQTGQTFSNKFVLLSLRKPTQTGTLETVRTVLQAIEPPKPQEIKPPKLPQIESPTLGNFLYDMVEQIWDEDSDSSDVEFPLTEKQARRIRIIWTVEVNGDQLEISHSLRECKTFSELLESLLEHVEDDPLVTTILQHTKVWRLTYQLPREKLEHGFSVRMYCIGNGSEVAYRQFVQSLAESPFWDKWPGFNLNVRLNPHTEQGLL